MFARVRVALTNTSPRRNGKNPRKLPRATFLLLRIPRHIQQSKMQLPREWRAALHAFQGQEQRVVLHACHFFQVIMIAVAFVCAWWLRTEFVTFDYAVSFPFPFGFPILHERKRVHGCNTGPPASSSLPPVALVPQSTILFYIR